MNDATPDVVADDKLTLTSFERFRVPLGNQEIVLQQVDYAHGGMSLLRVRIREGRRFTIFDIDSVTARRWAESMLHWAERQEISSSTSQKARDAVASQGADQDLSAPNLKPISSGEHVMVEEELLNPDVTLNLTGLSCPGPIIGAKKMIDELQEGQVLLLISDCPGTGDDLYAWAKNTGNHVVKVERFADDSSGYYIKRGVEKHRNAHVSLDMRGSVCPGPILEAKRLINGMSSGEVLCLISNCPGSRDDVEGWTNSTGLTLLEVVQIGPHEFEFFIRKS